MFDTKYLGQSNQPLVIVDDFHPNFEALRNGPKASDFSDHGGFYPGVQAPADPTHLQPVATLLTQIFKEIFNIQNGVSLVQCSYSLVTTAHENLAPIQRLPHVDTVDTGRFALLHYMSETDLGGTAFYRHRKSNMEFLTQENYGAYKTALESEGLPKQGYMNGSDERFEMIGKVESKPNRAILYKSALLHSGFISNEKPLSADPKVGRLTLNSFFQSRD